MKRSKVFAVCALVALSAVACEKRATPSAESVAAAADSARADSVRRADSTMKAEEAKIIGHDSAFGPIGTIDDTTLKLKEIPPRRP
jgi:hypothetical protein